MIYDVHKAIEFVVGGEAARAGFAMLGYPAVNVVRDSDIERVRAVGEDVDPELVVRFWALALLGFVTGQKRRFPSGMTNKSDYSSDLLVVSWGISVPWLRVMRPDLA